MSQSQKHYYNSIPLNQKNSLLQFLRTKDFNLPDLNKLLKEYQSMSTKSLTHQNKIKYKPSIHSKKVLSELKYVDNVVNKTNINTNDEYIAKTEGNLLNFHENFIIFKRSEDFQKGIPLLKLKQENFETKISFNKDKDISEMKYKGKKRYNLKLLNKNIKLNSTRTVKQIEYPPLTMRKIKSIEQMKPKRKLNLNTIKSCKEIDLTNIIPNVSQTSQNKKDYYIKLNTKYSSLLPKPFK